MHIQQTRMSFKIYSRELCSTIDHYKMEEMPTYTLPFLFPSRGISKLSMDGVASIKYGLHSVIRYLYFSMARARG